MSIPLNASEAFNASVIDSYSGLESQSALALEKHGVPRPYPNALTEWLLSKDLHQFNVASPESIFSGDERSFIVSTIVKPIVDGAGLTAIVLPSLDHVRRYRRILESFEIRLAMFDLAPTKIEKRKLWEALDKNEIDVVLISPGRLASTRFRERLAKRPITQIVVGAADVLSPWSHRFSPLFRQFAPYLRSFKHIKKTAHLVITDQRVSSDVQKALDLKTNTVVKLKSSTTLHPVLKGEVVQSKEDRLALMNDFISKHDCQGVIYLSSLKELYDTKSWLLTNGESCEVVRPGIDEFSLQKIKASFENGDVRIVLSLGAFLSNLEKAPGLEFVIFNGLPDSLEFVAQEILSHESASPLACFCLASDHDFFQHRFAIDKNFPDSLTLRACYKAAKDAFGKNLFLSPESLRIHIKVATPFPEDEIALCMAVMLREGLMEHVIDTQHDQVMIKLAAEADMEKDFWHEYPLRKLVQIGRLERTRDFLTTSGELGKSLRDLLKV